MFYSSSWEELMVWCVKLMMIGHFWKGGSDTQPPCPLGSDEFYQTLWFYTNDIDIPAYLIKERLDENVQSRIFYLRTQKQYMFQFRWNSSPFLVIWNRMPYISICRVAYQPLSKSIHLKGLLYTIIIHIHICYSFKI